MERRPRLVSGGAAAFVLAALVASLSILAHPTGTASATTSVVAAVGGPSLKITHGCDTGDGSGDWVEATLTPGSQVVDPDNPPVVQVGLATSADNHDVYLAPVGPVLVRLAGPTTVRLSGPIKGAHVFVASYGGANGNVNLNVLARQDVPAACQHVAKTNFGKLDPELSGVSNVATCVGSMASVTVKVENDGTTDADVTVALVRDGSFIGTAPQGKLLHIPVGASPQKVDLSQVSTSASGPPGFAVRVLSQDGGGADGGVKKVICDTQGTGHSGHPTTAPPRPSITVTATPPVSSKPTSPSSRPTATSSARTTAAHASASLTAASSTRHSSPPVVAGSPSGGGNDQGSVTSASVDAGGPVLGDADSTRQPSAGPIATASPKSKKVIVNAAQESRGVGSGFAAGGALILLAFAGAIAGMVAANRASARRR